MNPSEKNYKYLLGLYSLVDEYLADVPTKQENLPDVVVSFCIVTEKIFKIKLHKKNPVLVYENCKIKEDDALIAVIKEKELNIETIRIRETLNRYNLMFNFFSDDEIQVLIDIYNTRNHFVHGYKPDDEILSEKENIVKKMGTVWEKISIEAVSIFGNDLIKSNKPKKKYSEEELEKVLIEEVKTKIKSNQRAYGLNSFNVAASDYIIPVSDFNQHYSPTMAFTTEKCPRCGSYGFSLDDANSDIFLPTTLRINVYSTRAFSDLYKCKFCNLELTRKEYEIAKKLKK